MSPCPASHTVSLPDAFSGTDVNVEGAYDRVNVHGQDIIVIGASAEGIPALQYIAGNLDADLKAAIFVVRHLSPWHKSHLADIPGRAGPLPVAEAQGNVNVDYVVGLEEIPPLLTRLASGEEKPRDAEAAEDQRLWNPSRPK